RTAVKIIAMFGRVPIRCEAGLDVLKLLALFLGRLGRFRCSTRLSFFRSALLELIDKLGPQLIFIATKPQGNLIFDQARRRHLFDVAMNARRLRVIASWLAVCFARALHVSGLKYIFFPAL